MKNAATSDEIHFIKESIILPLILTIFDRDMKLIGAAVKTPGPYIDAMQRAMDRVTADIAEIRREFRQRGIKVYSEALTADHLGAEYKCRGYHGTITLLMNTLKSEVELRMRLYLGEDVTKYERKDLPEHITSAIGLMN